MTKKTEGPASGATEEIPEMIQCDPLELVDWQIPLEFRKKFYQEVIPRFGLAEMDSAVSKLTADLSKITKVSCEIPSNNKEDTDVMQSIIKGLAAYFNQELQSYLAVFNNDSEHFRNEQRREIEEISQ